jgi:hypothetical protein
MGMEIKNVTGKEAQARECSYKVTPLGRRLDCAGGWWVVKGYFPNQPKGRRDLFACEAHAKMRNSLGGLTFRAVPALRGESK